MPVQMEKLLEQYTEGIRGIYGKDLKSVILYGSYVDIMILIDVPSEQVDDKSKDVSYYTYDFNLDHDTDIMEMIVSASQFNYWREAHPFYRTVATEGRELYAS